MARQILTCCTYKPFHPMQPFFHPEITVHTIIRSRAQWVQQQNTAAATSPSCSLPNWPGKPVKPRSSLGISMPALTVKPLSWPKRRKNPPLKRPSIRFKYLLLAHFQAIIDRHVFKCLFGPVGFVVCSWYETAAQAR